ncbi:MAG: NUDIX domain-containing protein [Nostocaceae cyanobacterium CSU_2_110]|nr:NUDIX domain-containing protein [Richelia sp. SM1_7_0]NJN10388.1 NUDIX domain-containing protein [Richelia sp. RM1_1_1]NJO28933.1 NUDIX domain-containing protein [Richelia sp. SL_2_1]NJS16327.1 NUDIX domain-containing protein [Nostocaceae cyanobacterium CSU_2_110]
MRKITCGVFLMTKQGIFLVLKKSKNGEYDIPKGQMEEEHNNDELKCALDELKQETGILPNEIELDEDFRYEYNDPDGTKVIFLGWLDEEREIKLSSEHKDYKWKKWNPPHNIRKGWLNSLLEELDKYLN